MLIEAVDLFCGAGGLTAGLRQAGIKVKAGYDVDAACSFPYEFNNHALFIKKDVALVTSEEISGWYTEGSIRLLAGCAPCQPFSTYNKGRDASEHKQWPLLNHFSRLIREVRPELVTMENVPDVTKHRIYHDFVQMLIEQGYKVSAQSVVCSLYGVPQNRKRHVLMASLIGEAPLLIAPTHTTPVTVQDAIAHLSKLDAGQSDPEDKLHLSSNLSELNLARIKHSKAGGTWLDWPESLRAECHKRDSGQSYKSVYGRMCWDRPAPTSTTLGYGYGNGRFGHPEQDRAISLREAALLQSFPSDYEFAPLESKPVLKNISRMIGNAVPVLLGFAIGQSLRASVT